jgi:hypothetical protein
MSPVELGPENDCAGEDQQQFYTEDPSSGQRGTLYQRTNSVELSTAREVTSCAAIR